MFAKMPATEMAYPQTRKILPAAWIRNLEAVHPHRLGIQSVSTAGCSHRCKRTVDGKLQLWRNKALSELKHP